MTLTPVGFDASILAIPSALLLRATGGPNGSLSFKGLVAMTATRILFCLLITVLFGVGSVVRAEFDLIVNIPSPGSFTTAQLTELEAAIDVAETLWERRVTGYQTGIDINEVRVDVIAGSVFADAIPGSSINQGGFRLATSGQVRVNPAVIDTFAPWDGSGPTPPNTEFQGVNFLDDILAHEIGHVMGIGTLWVSNGLYLNGTGRYTGAHGLAAYQREFDLDATHVPVELGGSSGTMNSHWNQLMRSSLQEGDPNDPWRLDPRVGITDSQGRDFAFELMTGAIDPDFGEPFLSMTTIQSLRDLGFTVVPEPATATLLLLGGALLLTGQRRRPAIRLR